MISKNLALIVSDECTTITRNSLSADQYILRRGPNLNGILLLFPLLSLLPIVNAWSRYQPDIPGWFLILLGFGVVGTVVVFFILIYQWITPQLKIHRHMLICYGSIPWASKKINFAEITQVTLFVPAGHNALLLCIEIGDADYKTWIMDTRPFPVPRIRSMLEANFKEKYRERVM